MSTYSWHSGEVLQNNARKDELDFALLLARVLRLSDPHFVIHKDNGHNGSHLIGVVGASAVKGPARGV